jgi:UDP-N-acetylglucosamine 3-dehydrogenase
MIGHGGYPSDGVPSPDLTRPLRGAVIGLGMIGRHHARLLQTSPRVDFAGAVDPAGDRFGVVNDHDRLFADIGSLLRAGAPDFAIVAVPTEEHVATVRVLAAEGIHMLVEKPLAATGAEARALIDACNAAGVRGAVGHVERFNPALLELRRKAHLEGQLGQIFLIATERIGPFPDRIRDVGVIKDLATHDLDLVHWLGGAPVERVTAEIQHRMGREHEDMVLATGRLENAISFNCIVDWLSPTKVRRTRVLGERGMLVADTLTADLNFYANGTVASDWAESQALRGVSEGDMTRYALARREPLLVELETFCDFVAGDPDAAVVTLSEGLETVVVAEAALASAEAGSTVRLAGAGRERPEADRQAQIAGLDAPRRSP